MAETMKIRRSLLENNRICQRPLGEAGLKKGSSWHFLKMNLPIPENMKHTGLSEEETKIHYK